MIRLPLIVLLIAVLLTKPIMAQKIEVLRTPDERFADLTDYPFAANYVSVAPGIRMHYVDEGNKAHPVILLVHGEPSWSYLYRNMIPILVKQGYRVVAPDLVGFGKSDKPTDKAMYKYQNHTTWLTTFIDQLHLRNIYLYCHDWGGMISLRIVAGKPDLFSSVAVSYAFLFTGNEQIPESFTNWQSFSQTDSAFSAGTIVNWGSYRELPKHVQQAYDAPYPEESYKVGARQFPVMIPTKAEDPEAKTNAMLREKLKNFNKPFLTIWGDNDDAMWLGKDKILQAEIPGAKNQEHRILHAHHFLQEDKSEEITEALIRFFPKR